MSILRNGHVTLSNLRVKGPIYSRSPGAVDEVVHLHNELLPGRHHVVHPASVDVAWVIVAELLDEKRL